MNLNTFSLRVFLEVADKGSFSGAAKALFLTQPAVSLQIRNLENHFGTPLVIRHHSSKIKLTDAGKILFRHAKKSLQLQNELLKEIEKHTGNSLMQLRLGTCNIAGEYLLPHPLKTFTEKYPELKVSLNITRWDKVFDGLLSGIFDVGITGVAPKCGGLVKKKMTRIPLAVFECGNGGAHSRTASIRELIHTPLVMREEGSGTRQEFQVAIAKQGMNLKQFELITVSESNKAIKNLVMKEVGFSILPHLCVEEELEKGELGEIRLEEGGLSQQFFLIYRKQDVISRPHQQFLEFILTA